MRRSRLPSFGRKPARMTAVALFSLLPIAVANVGVSTAHLFSPSNGQGIPRAIAS